MRGGDQVAGLFQYDLTVEPISSSWLGPGCSQRSGYVLKSVGMWSKAGE